MIIGECPYVDCSDERITREKFIAATGREPEDDDLERCNCPHAGEITHWYCGWDEIADKPMFMTGRRAHEITRKAMLALAEAGAGRSSPNETPSS